MKTIYLAILASFLLCLTGYSQDCKTPVSSMLFKQEYNQLSVIRNEQKKLTLSIDFVQQNCLLTYQVKEMAGLFADDYTRLSFAEAAYCSTLDKANFYDVYDAFAHFSAVMRLHDYVLFHNESEGHKVNYQGGTTDRYDFPEYEYPSYGNYREETKCKNPVSENDFYVLLNSVIRQRTDELKSIIAIQHAENNCLAIEQIMKLASYIHDERIRWSFLKKAHGYSYDSRNFRYSRQLLSNSAYIKEFDTYLGRHNRPVSNVSQNPPTRRRACKVSETEFVGILKTIEDRNFNDVQVTTAKQIVRSKECFTVDQIKRMLKIFSFESSKFDMAKYCYNYCIDKDNYYKVSDVFSYSGTIRKMDEFLREQ